MLEAGVTSRLLADATTSALVGTRIYALLLPETPSYPAVTYQRIATTPTYTLQGSLHCSRVRMQFDAWSTAYSDCKNAVVAIRASLEDFSGTLPDGTYVGCAQVSTMTDYFDPDARLYRCMIEFTLIVTE